MEDQGIGKNKLINAILIVIIAILTYTAWGMYQDKLDNKIPESRDENLEEVISEEKLHNDSIYTSDPFVEEEIAEVYSAPTRRQVDTVSYVSEYALPSRMEFVGKVSIKSLQGEDLTLNDDFITISIGDKRYPLDSLGRYSIPMPLGIELDSVKIMWGKMPIKVIGLPDSINGTMNLPDIVLDPNEDNNLIPIWFTQEINQLEREAKDLNKYTSKEFVSAQNKFTYVMNNSNGDREVLNAAENILEKLRFSINN